MRKLILKCGLSPGDIVMMTAAVRDLQLCCPGQFLVDVRTSCSEIWDNNPHLTSLSESHPSVEVIDCSYPLIDECNWTPYHSVHGYIHFLNDQLDLSIKPTLFKGDIHLSVLERSWYSQVHEVTGKEIPFWIVAAGGKYDVTVKWWPIEKYQQVVDHFRGRIQFVQVGARGHHHPRLDGVIDLRGQTDLRQLIRLVYHAQGVLCPVTALMHLAAAVETKTGHSRPCVVVAGGREPAHWEAYPEHQFIHTNGALPCCPRGGCWKDRVVPLGDGDERDHPDHLCLEPVGNVAKCMDLIGADEVIRRISLYFQGGALQYLSKEDNVAAHRGRDLTIGNDFDSQPLNLHNARGACEQFIKTIPDYPGGFEGRGIVICGGGVRYFTNAWVCINMLRHHGCVLPIEFWHLGKEELDQDMQALLSPLNVRCVDAARVRKKCPARRLDGWELKAYAIVHSRFKEVLLLDADNVPVADPEYLFNTIEFRTVGAVFWPDYMQHTEGTKAIWQSCGLSCPETPEVESGQILIDKAKCWKALRLALWLNENSDFYYRYLHGDKETFPIAFAKTGHPYAMIPTPIHRLTSTMCQHDFEGRRIFQHRNCDKWNLFLDNERVEDFWFEENCRRYVRDLQTKWNGRTNRYLNSNSPEGKVPSLFLGVINLDDATPDRFQKACYQTDWPDSQLMMADHCRKSVDEIVRSALSEALKRDFDYLVFMQRGLSLDGHAYEKLRRWKPLKAGEVSLAVLLKIYGSELAYDLPRSASVVSPEAIYGPLGCVISKQSIPHLLRHWDEVSGPPSTKLAFLAARLQTPLLCHVPALLRQAPSEKGLAAHARAD